MVKPRDGCGTQQIKIFDSFEDARAELEDDLILQAWMPGRAISVALVASPSHQTFLPAVSQTLSEAPASTQAARALWTMMHNAGQRRSHRGRSRRCLPPCAASSDWICCSEIVRAKIVSIEINPRLTTSYVGLRRMIHGNLAARLFDLETGPVSCCTPVDSVRWTPDGQVWINDAVA